jgi:hypothetical protein
MPENVVSLTVKPTQQSTPPIPTAVPTFDDELTETTAFVDIDTIDSDTIDIEAIADEHNIAVQSVATTENVLVTAEADPTIEASLAEHGILADGSFAHDNGSAPDHSNAYDDMIGIDTSILQSDTDETLVVAVPTTVSQSVPETAPRAREAQVQPAASPERSLGEALLARGVVTTRNPHKPDPLAPLRRMSQAEKIAFFS